MDDRQLYEFCGFPGCSRPHAGEQTQTGDLDRCGAVQGAKNGEKKLDTSLSVTVAASWFGIA